jgi:hypothetical protein
MEKKRTLAYVVVNSVKNYEAFDLFYVYFSRYVHIDFIMHVCTHLNLSAFIHVMLCSACHADFHSYTCVYITNNSFMNRH